jgi:hypothetical protein
MGLFQFAKKKEETTAESQDAAKSASSKTSPVQAAGKDAHEPVRTQPAVSPITPDSSREVVRQRLIFAHLADGELSKAELLAGRLLTPDMTVAVVLRRGSDVLVYHPSLTGASWHSLVHTLKRLDGMDGLYSTTAEDLRIDIYKPASSTKGEKTGPGNIWVEPRFEHRGVDPIQVEKCMQGQEKALLPCSNYEEALAHPHGIATFQGFAGGVYGYLLLGAAPDKENLKIPSAARMDEIVKKLIEPFSGHDVVTLGFEAVKDRPAILESSLYLGVNEDMLEDAEAGQDPKQGSAAKPDPAYSELPELRIPHLYVRKEIAQKVKTALAKKKAKAS